MRAHVALASAALACLLAGCAQFELYDKDNKEIKGFKYYTAKPYVLVGRTGSSDEPFSITPTYLPDIENPIYAKAKPGWLGNSNLKMQFNDNGTLHDFGQEGDNNISDLVNQLGGFAKNIADAQVARAGIGAAEEPITPAEGKSVAQMLDTARLSADGSLDATLKNQKQERDGFNAPSQKLASTARELASPSKLPDRFTVENRLREVLAEWRVQTQALKDGKDNEVRAGLARAIEIVRAALRRIRSGKADDAHFTLYEVIMDQGRPKLREVPFMPRD